MLESLLELGQVVRRWNPRVLGASGDDPAAGGEADKVCVCVGWCVGVVAGWRESVWGLTVDT